MFFSLARGMPFPVGHRAGLVRRPCFHGAFPKVPVATGNAASCRMAKPLVRRPCFHGAFPKVPVATGNAASCRMAKPVVLHGFSVSRPVISVRLTENPIRLAEIPVSRPVIPADAVGFRDAPPGDVFGRPETPKPPDRSGTGGFVGCDSVVVFRRRPWPGAQRGVSIPRPRARGS